jgi:hypothetical protein
MWYYAPKLEQVCRIKYRLTAPLHEDERNPRRHIETEGGS